MGTLDEQVDHWKTEIKKFRVIAEVADKDAQVKHYQIIEEITDKINAFTDKLDDLKKDSAKQLEGLVDDLDGLKDEVNEAIESARKKIN
jgi:hypothetical protein